MNPTRQLMIVGAAALLNASSALAQFAVGTAFTYQGRLTENAAPANGLFDLQFALFNNPAIGSPLAGPIIREDVSVTNGLFTTTIDFGQPLPAGFACWMSVGVRPGASSGGFTALTPRLQLTPAPIAASLGMPFFATVNSATTLFTISQTGAGGAMSITSTNADALSVSATSGDAVHASATAGGNGINGTSTGTGSAVRGASSGPGAGVFGQASGGGAALYGYNLGTSGHAGFFRTESASNASDALRAESNGPGIGVHALAAAGTAGKFEIAAAGNASNALHARTTGTGRAAYVEVAGVSNAANALEARTTGTGRAAYVEIVNPANTANALEVRTTGAGRAGKFVGDVEVNGALYGNCGALLNRAAPIAFGSINLGTHAWTVSSGNVEFTNMSPTGTLEIKVTGEPQPEKWLVVATVDATLTDVMDVVDFWTVMTGRPKAVAGEPNAGTFNLVVRQNHGGNYTSSSRYHISFVVYKGR